MAKKTKTQPKARKTITSNNLADLSKLVQALEIDDENPENQQKPSALDKKIIYNEFQNSTYTLVSPMAYLIGIDKENFGEENARPFLQRAESHSIRSGGAAGTGRRQNLQSKAGY